MSHQCEHEHHDHSPPPVTNSTQSLYEHINFLQVVCLNVVAKGSDNQSACVFKTQDEKYNVSRYLESDADCQMIIHVPFTGTCKLFSIVLRCNRTDGGYSSPKTIKLYKNFNKNVDFDTLSESKDDHHFENPQDIGIGVGIETDVLDDSTFVEHHLPRHIFQNCYSLTLFIQDNWTADEDDLTCCFYLELRGEYTGERASNDAIPLMTVYESAPNPVDHQKLEYEHENMELGM